ncbi:hypothetical protein CARUB_v10016547mg, partial [Capsella rubella]
SGASWTPSGSLSGLGWVLIESNKVVHLGLKSFRRSLSPLHAELDALLWAMECMSKIGTFTTSFATDCSDLVKMIEKPLDWPSFAAELESFKSLQDLLPGFHIRFIPRLSNTRADHLAKNARSRDCLFSYMSTSAPSWLPLAESFFLSVP